MAGLNVNPNIASVPPQKVKTTSPDATSGQGTTPTTPATTTMVASPGGSTVSSSQVSSNNNQGQIIQKEIKNLIQSNNLGLPQSVKDLQAAHTAADKTISQDLGLLDSTVNTPQKTDYIAWQAANKQSRQDYQTFFASLSASPLTLSSDNQAALKNAGISVSPCSQQSLELKINQLSREEGTATGTQKSGIKQQMSLLQGILNSSLSPSQLSLAQQVHTDDDNLHQARLTFENSIAGNATLQTDWNNCNQTWKTLQQGIDHFEGSMQTNQMTALNEVARLQIQLNQLAGDSGRFKGETWYMLSPGYYFHFPAPTQVPDTTTATP